MGDEIRRAVSDLISSRKLGVAVDDLVRIAPLTDEPHLLAGDPRQDYPVYSHDFVAIKESGFDVLWRFF